MRRFQIEPGAYFLAAAGLLLLPLRVLLAITVSAAVHEGFHYFAARIMGIRVYSLRMDVRGCLLDTEPMTRWQELFCAAAGPLGSLLLLGLIRKLPLLALCGVAQGLFNLLPLYPLDGGRILYCVAALTAGEGTAASVCRWSDIVVISLLLCAGFYVAVWMEWGILPAILGVFWAVRIGKTKNSLQTGSTRGTIELPFSKR